MDFLFFSMNRRLLWLLCVVFLSLLSSCRKEENPPTFSITSPNGPVADSATAILHIIGSATDESGLSSLEATLIADNGKVESSQYFQLSGASTSFDCAFTLGHLFTFTGSYTLKITLSDIHENYSSDFYNVTLTEVPYRTLKVVMAARQAGNAFDLYHRPLGMPAEFVRPLANDLVGLHADNMHSSIHTANTAGEWDNIDIRDYSPQCHDEFVVEPLYTGYKAFAVSGALQYGITGTVEACRVNQIGCIYRGPMPDVNMTPTSVGVESTAVFVGGTTGAGVHKVDRHASGLQGLSHTHVLDWAPLFLHGTGLGWVVAAGNQGGSGKLAILDASNLTEVRLASLPEPILHMTSGGGKACCVTASGMLTVDLASGTASGVLRPGTFHSIAWDRSDNTLYLGKTNGLEHVRLDGTLIEDISGVTGTVEFISFVRNK
jgi:hypothetical protein